MINLIDRFMPYLTYSIQMLICLIPFIIFFPRRKHFVWLLSAAVASFFIGSFVLSLLFPFRGTTVLLSTLHFILIDALLGALLFIPFKINGWYAVPIAVGAYAVQHITNQILRLITITFNINTRGFWGFMSNYGVYVITAVISFFVFSLPIKKEGTMGRKDPALLIVSGACIIITTFISSSANQLIRNSRVLFEGNEVILSEYRIIFSCYAVISCFLCLFCLFELFSKSKLQSMLVAEEKKFETVTEMQEIINIKVHDMKHIIRLWESGENIEDRSKEIEELKNAILKYESAVNTGNPTLNTLIQENFLICDKNGIQFSFIVNGELIGFMQPLDIVVMFGNALDNAVNYLKTVEDREKRILSLFVQEKLGKVYICVENYLEDDNLKFFNGLPVTSRDKNEHGFGCKSIKKTALKYGGNMFVTAEDNKFKLEILFDT